MSETHQSGLRQAAPSLTLLVLSPVIVELLFGSTHLTIISALIPEVGFYGGAALLIRYLVRRQRRGWFSILLLGIAFAVFEEFLVVQTSLSTAAFAPIVAAEVYGRAFGVNWVYLLWAAGYESTWGIVLPIYLTELVFPGRRADPWLGGRGLFTTAAVFLLASLVSWYIWTQVVAPGVIGSTYSPPSSLIALGLAIIAALGIAALGLRPSLRPGGRTAGEAPRPLLVGALAFGLGLASFAVLAFTYGMVPAVPPAAALAAGLILAGACLLLVRRLSASVGWGDPHRLAVVFGALAASMLAGFWASGIVLAVDFAGKIALNAIALVLLLYLAWMLRNRGRSAPGALEGLSRGAEG